MTNSFSDIFANYKLTKNEEKDTCKGLVFRCKLNAYVNKRGDYVEEKRMTLLKRKSCKGCDGCGWMQESLGECIYADALPIIDDPEPDALYMLTVTNESRDYETGHIDDYDHEFIKIKETENE